MAIDSSYFPGLAHLRDIDPEVEFLYPYIAVDIDNLPILLVVGVSEDGYNKLYLLRKGCDAVPTPHWHVDATAEIKSPTIIRDTYSYRLSYIEEWEAFNYPTRKMNQVVTTDIDTLDHAPSGEWDARHRQDYFTSASIEYDYTILSMYNYLIGFDPATQAATLCSFPRTIHIASVRPVPTRDNTYLISAEYAQNMDFTRSKTILLLVDMSSHTVNHVIPSQSIKTIHSGHIHGNTLVVSGKESDTDPYSLIFCSYLPATPAFKVDFEPLQPDIGAPLPWYYGIFYQALNEGVYNLNSFNKNSDTFPVIYRKPGDFFLRILHCFPFDWVARRFGYPDPCASCLHRAFKWNGLGKVAIKH